MNDTLRCRMVCYTCCCGSNTHTLQFLKQNEVGLPLEHAVFELRRGTDRRQVSSDSSGIVRFPNLPVGTYEMEEITPPVGYYPNSHLYQVVVNQRGVYIDGIKARDFRVTNTPIPPATRVVTYDPNQTEFGEMPHRLYLPDGTIHSILDNPFYSENTFVEWNTNPDGSGISYQPGTNIPIHQDITLYAIWKSRIPTIHLVKVGDTVITGIGIPGSLIEMTFPGGTMVTTTVGSDGAYQVTVPIREQPLRVGSTIQAIQTEPRMIPSDPNQVIVIADSFVFQKVDQDTGSGLEGAVFQIRDGSTIMGEATSDQNGNVLFTQIPSGDYWMFELTPPPGYRPSGQVSRVLVSPTGEVLIDGIPATSFTFPNQLERLVTITYDPNQTEFGENPFSLTVPAGTIHTILSNLFYSENTFLFWNTKPDGSGITYYPNDSMIAENDIRLYAIWKSRIPTVDRITTGSFLLTGTGIPSSIITITFPDGEQGTTIVSENGFWSYFIPGSIVLAPYDLVKFNQTEPNFVTSDDVVEPVIPPA